MFFQSLYLACNQSQSQSPVCVTEVVLRNLMSGACWQEGGVSLSKNKQAVKRCSEVGGEQTLHRPRPLHVTVCPRGRQNVSVCAHVFFECRFLMSECVPLLVFLRSQVCMCVCDVRWGEVRWSQGDFLLISDLFPWQWRKEEEGDPFSWTSRALEKSDV